MTLRQQLRVIWRMARIEIAGALAYRVEFVLFMLSNMMSPLIGILIWRAAINAGAALPMSTSEVTTYFVMMGAVRMLTSSWISWFLADSIRSGDLNRWLCRPGSTHFNGIGNNLGEKLVKAGPLTPMVLALGIIFRHDLRLPSDPTLWLLFMMSIAMTATMTFASDIVVGSLGFWMDDVRGVDVAKYLLYGVLSGQAIPLSLYPEGFSAFLDVQPFRYMLSFPLEMITGTVSGNDLALGFVAQIMWTALTVWAARTIWRRGLRGYAAVGA